MRIWELQFGPKWPETNLKNLPDGSLGPEGDDFDVGNIIIIK
jgi:hypothetical protein